MSAKKSFSYQQLQKNRWFLVALTLGLVVLVVAIFLELVRSQTTSQVDPKLNRYAVPLAPTFKEDVFEKLDTFTYLSPQEVRAEVERLPIRIIDRETKQIVTLQEKKASVSTASAQAETTSVQTEDFSEEDSNLSAPVDGSAGNDAVVNDIQENNDVPSSNDVNQESPSVPQDVGILPE